MLNTKKLFTKLDFEFLPVKSGFKKTDSNTVHGNEAQLLSFFKTSLEWKYLPKLALNYSFFILKKKYRCMVGVLLRNVSSNRCSPVYWDYVPLPITSK